MAPAYYDSIGTNWLNSFTAGYLTTCGLNNVGSPNIDEGTEYPLHGTVANIPCDSAYFYEDKTTHDLIVKTVTRDETIFSRKFTLEREVAVSTKENVFTITDTISNNGDTEEPFEILYHMNMGYPLLDEDSIITIKSSSVKARDAHAQEDIANWMHMQKPTADIRRDATIIHLLMAKDMLRLSSLN